MDLVRVQKGTPSTITKTFEVGGVGTDPSPDSATVAITRDDGTVVVAAGTAATNGAAAGQFTFQLTAAMTAQLDVLTVTWTTANLGSLTTTVEVVGGFLFSIAEARALVPLNDTATYTTQKIIDARTYVEADLEQSCGVAFVPRYRRETVSGMGATDIMLSMPRVTAIRSVSRDGTAVTAQELAAIVPSGPGVIHTANGWTAGFGNYSIAYEHGYSDGAERVAARQAALTYAKEFLVQGPVSSRATGLSTDDGTIAYSTPGVRGAVTGIPAVDSFIQRYSLNVAVA